ncbi:hypothetical protein ACIXWV_23245 [Bacteroides fragilis]
MRVSIRTIRLRPAHSALLPAAGLGDNARRHGGAVLIAAGFIYIRIRAPD